ncbi:MAG: NUDIX hydrolase [Acidimicrobiales bacterium]
MPIEVIDHPHSPNPAHPASTVLLLRDGESGLEVLMIHRSSKTAFGGLWAFPGGRIEDEDIPEGTEPDPLPAARRAASRETMEEVGLPIEADSLVWVSHWLPPANAPIRFSTWFFAGPAPDALVAIDQDEVHDHRWMSPAQALASHHAGEIELVTPTFVTLEGLVQHGNVAAALDRGEPEFFATRIAKDATGARVCLYAGDAGYDSGDCSLDGPRRRLVMGKPRWAWFDDTR